MNRTVISALGTLVFAGLALTGIARVSASEPRIPYPEALDAAAVSVDRLDSILEYALLVGNGDINALVYSDGGQLKLMLTKNDVWDARLDSKLDPPLPTLALIKKLGPVSPTKYGTSSVILDEGSTWQGPDSYHAHPYPCPRPCARLVLSERPEQPCWKNIRALGFADQSGKPRDGRRDGPRRAGRVVQRVCLRTVERHRAISTTGCG